ncbi:MAG: ABC transporter substrate-binding protein [Acidimicrobiaceae bacterium]|nr:ABC transporter substrate-binding protein [Acidimicrobiaceae bacterium]
MGGLAALSAVAMTAAACSSSKGTSTSNTTASHSTSGSGASQPSGSPIKIGAICTCSGPLASETAQTPDIYKAWADSVNASGGINGHPIQVIVDDDAGNAGTSITDVHQLVGSQHVVALVDMTDDDETWASYVQSQNVPVIGSGTSTTPMYTNPDFYPEAQTEDALFPSIIDAAKGAGATNLALLYCAEAVQCQEGIAPLKQVGKQLGLPVSYAAQVSATAPDYTAQCVAAQQKHMTAVFIADTASVANKVAQNCSQQNYHPIYVIDGESISPSYTSTPGIKDNLVGPSPNLPYYANTPAIQAMNQALDKYFPGLRKNASGYTEVASEAWPAGLLFADAAKAGGLGANGSTPTSAQLVKGLESLKGDTLQGFAPPLTFAAGKPHPVHCWFSFSLKNGTFGLPKGNSTTCE